MGTTLLSRKRSTTAWLVKRSLALRAFLLCGFDFVCKLGVERSKSLAGGAWWWANWRRCERVLCRRDISEHLTQLLGQSPPFLWQLPRRIGSAVNELHG
jgi:hypothetical protein